MTEAIIQIQDLEKRFRSKNTEVYALQGINLTIRKGDIFGIIGKSGAGKSTLVRCINMLERPTGGSVMFEGRDMCRLGSRDLQIARRSMGMIFQQFNLLMQRTAEENICFPLELAGVKKDAARERARELLELVNLSDRAQSYPSQLSGGQKQRLISFPMLQFFCIGNHSAKGFADALMSQTHTQNWDFSSELFDHRNTDACLLRSSRTRGKNNCFRCQLLYFSQGNFVISNHLNIRINGPDQLIQVIGKAVVIINQ